MMIASFNCRGLARPEKKLALCRLILTSPIDVIFLQETLGPADTITHLLEAMLPRWRFIGIDANGSSGGLALRYNIRSTKLCNCWGALGHIVVDLFASDLGLEMRVINVYGPFQHRLDF